MRKDTNGGVISAPVRCSAGRAVGAGGISPFPLNAGQTALGDADDASGASVR
jgi:hypothetical protein